MLFFFFKQKTAYEMRISDWSSDVCSSDLLSAGGDGLARQPRILGMGDDGEAEAGGVGEDAHHHARIRDPLAAGADRLRACRLHHADFGQFRALEAPRGGGDGVDPEIGFAGARSEEHTSELQSLMRISYAVFCLKKKKPKNK